jgi:1-deoxy-D-xylulose-5-phosphate reductoisomerase
MKSLCLLGSTGSIGLNTLDVVRRLPGRFRIRSLTAGSNAERLAKQAREFQPARIAVADARAYPALKERLEGWPGEILAGAEALAELAGERESDCVVSAIVGAAGLLPTLAALRRGKQVALANKEPLVMAGPLMQAAARASGASLVPIDSEHSGVFQAARAGNHGELRRIVLTASGGPFLEAAPEEMARATKSEALKHPIWKMGAKITVDSATLMNKALEILEAHFLFGLPYEGIEVWVHPQSIVHALVEFQDGAVLAQLGLPDMRLPIQDALTHPERVDGGLPALPLSRMKSLTFQAPDRRRFPSLDLGYAAGRSGGTAPAALNGANEEAVQLFLNDRIRFGQVVELVGEALAAHRAQPLDELSAALQADLWAREEVRRRAAKAGAAVC